MVEVVRSVAVRNDNYGTKAAKYGTVAGITGAVLGAGMGALSMPHMTSEVKGGTKEILSDKFIKQATLNLDNSLLKEDEVFCKQFLSLNPRKVTAEKLAELFANNRSLFEEICDMSFEEAKQCALKEIKGDAKPLEKQIKELHAECVGVMRKNKFASWFDEGGMLKEVGPDVSEATKSIRESLSKTLKNFILKSAGKWALCTGVALGTIGLAIGACNKKEPPKISRAGFESVA